MSRLETRDGIELYYKDWGSGRPVVLLHGWPLSADSFDELSLAIATAGMRAVAYDRRGFGRSAQPWSGYDYDTLVDDLAAVIETLQLRDATLVGFSMGGGEVARYMSRHGGRHVVQAVLISSVVPYLPKTEDNPQGVERATLDQMAAGISADRAKFWPQFLKDFYGVSVLSHPVSEETRDWSARLAMQAGLRPTLACAQAFSSTDFRPDLAAFKVPTLVIHGTKDQTVPIECSGRAAAAGISDSQLLEYEGGPHGLLVTHREQLTRDLLTFLRKV